jgi:hypothetical protein
VLNFESPETESRIEDYLDQTCAPMVKQKPYEERSAIREELRNHLCALVRASIELGAAESEAVASALRRMGKPQVVARSFGVRRQFPWPALALGLSLLVLAIAIGGPRSAPPAQDTSPTLQVALGPAPATVAHAQLASTTECYTCHMSVTSSFQRVDVASPLKGEQSPERAIRWRFRARENR